MQTPLPPEVQVTDLWPASLRLALPRRDLGRGKLVCWLLLAAGLIEMALLAHLIQAALGGPNFILGSTLASFVSIFGLLTLAGTVPIWWGLAGLVGHRELEIKNDRLMTVERIGPFWRSKRWKIDSIYAFDVVPLVGDEKSNEQHPTPEIFKRMNVLLVRLEIGKQGMLAWGYPAEMLKPIAAALAEMGNAALQRSGQSGEIEVLVKWKKKGVAGGSEDEDEDEFEEDNIEDEEDSDGLPTRPADSRIEIERFPDGLTIRVPPAGIRKGSSGLFFFSLLWNGFMTVFSVFCVLGLVQGKANDFDGNEWILGLFLGVFWFVGIAMLLGAINMGRRQAALAVTGGQLMVLQTGLFGKKQRDWPAGEVKEIRAGPSGMEMNNVPILELQIVDQAGKKFGLLAGRDDAELHWLAWELTQAVSGRKTEVAE